MSQEFREEEEEIFDLKAYARRYIRYWYLFPIFIAISLIAAVFYLKTTQPVYSTKTSILIKDQKKGFGGAQGDILAELGGQLGGNKLVENELEILKSQTFMEQVVQGLGLEVSYTTKQGLSTVSLYNESPVVVKPEVISEFGYEEPLVIELVDAQNFTLNKGTAQYAFGKRIQNEWGTFTVSKGKPSDVKTVEVQLLESRGLAETMLKNLTVQQPNIKSTVIELTYEDVSIQRGQDILNKLLEIYVQTSLNDKNSEATNTLKFIETRLGLVTGELSEVEKDVEVYKTTKGLTDISAESQLFLEKIKENDTKLNEVNTQISILESVDNYIKKDTEGAVAPATYMVSDPVLVSLLNKFNELSLQRERYARTTSPNNPLLETINTQISGTRQAIRENVQNLRRGLEVTKQSLQSVSGRASANLRSIPQKEREYIGIKRQQSIKEGLYLYLLQKREETALMYASTVTDSRLIDAPITTFKPVKPKKLLVVAGAGLIGLMIPIFLINLLFLLNNTVQTREEIEQNTKVSVLGEVGQLKSEKEGFSDNSIIKMTSRSVVSEQFRALRTNLQYIGSGKSQVIMFTSSIGGEGKSFVSINLAASLAFSDKKVLLIGLDLRKPTLHERLSVRNQTGISNLLIGQGKPHDYIQKTAVHQNLDVLTSGPIPPNPSELISNGRLPELLEELRKEYDYILIDSPPYGLVTDSSIITNYVDATLYLVRFNYTLIDHLKRIGDLNQQKRITNMSIIFNGLNYGAGYGYGGYGYGYYGEDMDNKKGLISRFIKMITRA
jgi:tyrosine-protein kinase Etk/Wzc